MNILVGFEGTETSKVALRKTQKHVLAINSHLDVVSVVVRQSADQSEKITRAGKALEPIQIDCEEKGITCRM